jgi:hypothetical protein
MPLSLLCFTYALLLIFRVYQPKKTYFLSKKAIVAQTFAKKGLMNWFLLINF